MKRILSLYSLIAILLGLGASDVLAQNVVVDKSSLTFSAQVSGPAVSQALTLTSSTSAVITFSIFSNASWVKVNNQAATNGTTPSTVTVSADPTGFTPGTYNTSLTVFGGPNSISVPIALTVSSIGVNPSSITFAPYIAGSNAIPSPQSITVTGSTAFNASASTSSGGQWLQANASSGAVTAVLNPAVLPSLAVGTYQGTITITPTATGNNVPVNVAVTLTVVAAPAVTVTPPAIQFNVQQPGGTNNITSQAVTIATSPATSLNYTVTASFDPALSNKITISPSTSGATNAQTGQAQVTVAVDPTNLVPNTYNGTISVFAPGGAPQQVNIPLKVVVSTTPLLNIPTTALSFSYNLGGASPAAQTVNVGATSGTLAYTVSVDASKSPWLSVSTVNGTTAAPFSVTVNPAGLAPGTYAGTINVLGNTGGSGSGQISVTFTVTNNPSILTSPTSIQFPYQIGQALPAALQMKISSSTGTPISFTASSTETTCGNSNWLVLNGNFGVAVSGSTDATLVVSANATGLPAGTCTGSISITGTIGATTLPTVTVPVTLYVSNSALLVFTPGSLSFNAALNTPSVPQQSITLTSTSPTDQLTYTASVTAPATGPQWLFVGQQSGSTASNNTLPVFVVSNNLVAGTYTSSIVITATGPNNAAVANSPVTIPVTLTITAGSLTLSATSANFSYTLGGSAPSAQTVNITSSGQPLTYTAVATSTNNWLTVNPGSGNTTTNSLLTIGIDTTKIAAPGTYNGTITVTAPGAGNSPATINVTLTVVAGALSVSPNTTLTFTQVAGGAAPSAQSLAISGSPAALNFTVTTSSNTPWLGVSSATGTTPASVQVQVNAGAMPAGAYNGSVVITSAGATGSPITVPVVLNVVAAQTLSANPASLTFNYTIGLAAPVSQSLVVNTTGNSAPISVQFQSTGNWLQVSPTSATAPATLTVSVNPGSLQAGTYTGNITITSPNATASVPVSVTLNVVSIPKPVITAVANAASYTTGGLSPGENIVIFGTGVGPAAIASGSISNSIWGTVAGNTRVLFDGVPAPVIYASSTQTSVMVPYGIGGRAATSVVVEFSGVQSNPLSYSVAATAPGIYTLNQQGTGGGAIINQNGFTVNGPNTPERRGNVISVYMTGEGQTIPSGVDGAIIPPVLSALKNPLAKVTATVGGIDAQVQYAGSAAGLISGVMQVNLTIPATAPSGSNVPIVITVGNTTTQPGVTVAVQ